MKALRSVTRGRVAISSAALPAIETVDFALDGDSVVFDAAAGSRLAAATENAVVAFQADSHGTGDEVEWSVVVVGLSRRVTDPVEIARVRALIPNSTTQGTDHVVRIPITKLEGKRTTPRVAMKFVSLGGGQH
jgi:hypothetical protein